MHASDYLRYKFQSDRHLALNVQKGFGGVMQTAMGVASDIYSGMERTIWYSSCFIPVYNNVCQELKAEELRSVYSVHSIYRYRDVIQEMLFLYFSSITKDMEEGNTSGSVRKFVKKGANLSSNFVVTKGTRLGFALAISLALAKSEFISKTTIQKLSGKTHIAVVALQAFGIQQKCALAARRLKAIDPEYYGILYQAKLEMLYYFIEPLLSDIIKKVKSGTINNLNELAEDIKGKYNV